MAQTIPDPRLDDSVFAQPDHERLDCYRVAVEFAATAARLTASRHLGSVRNQLERASASIMLNIAEGVGRRTASDKAHFFTIARGSANECSAILDLLLMRDLVTPSCHRAARGRLVRIIQMLTRLIDRQRHAG